MMKKLKPATKVVIYVSLGILSGAIAMLIILWLISGPIAGTHYRREVQRRNNIIEESFEFTRHAAELFTSGDRKSMFEITIDVWDWAEDNSFEESSFILPEGLYLEFIDLQPHVFSGRWDTGRFFHTFTEEHLFASFSVKFRVIGDLPDDMGRISGENIKITEVNGERIYEIFLVFYVINMNAEWSLHSIMYDSFFF